jgi:hypothetical protein
MTLILSEKQQAEFLRILRPIPPKNVGTITSCLPNYRHAILIYGSTDSLIGQIHICFGCDQVEFFPEPDCLNFFDNERLDELKAFFQANGIPIMAY